MTYGKLTVAALRESQSETAHPFYKVRQHGSGTSQWRS